MDAILQIKVRIVARDAIAQLEAVKKATRQVSAVGGEFDKAFGQGYATISKFNSALASGLHRMESYGKNLQWTGRQLTYTFTLPLALAGGAALKFALDNEAAMTDVRKVYGDSTTSAATLKKEVDALAVSFRLLSDRFGVAQSEVIGIGREWAQAGSAGVGLAKSTRLTMEAMIIGSMDAQEATKGLIAVQGVYRLSTDDLRKTLELMNAVENTTATDMSDLITSFTQAGGTARVAGVDVRHLAAMTAALVPAAGSASTAGNALKTIISRIMAPTKQAEAAMKKVGIEVNSVGWQSLNATQRLEKLAWGMNGLSQSEKSVVAAAVAGRRQQSRFIQLVTEMTDKQGMYARALKSTSDQEKAHVTYQRELMTYLNSNPQKVKILTTMFKNFLAEAIIPLMPAIIGVLKAVSRLAQGFSNLSPSTQKFIMFSLLAVAVLGPFIQTLGGVILLFSQLGKGILFVGRALGLVLKTSSIFGRMFESMVMKSFNFSGVTALFSSEMSAMSAAGTSAAATVNASWSGATTTVSTLIAAMAAEVIASMTSTATAVGTGLATVVTEVAATGTAAATATGGALTTIGSEAIVVAGVVQRAWSASLAWIIAMWRAFVNAVFFGAPQLAAGPIVAIETVQGVWFADLAAMLTAWEAFVAGVTATTPMLAAGPVAVAAITAGSWGATAIEVASSVGEMAVFASGAFVELAGVATASASEAALAWEIAMGLPVVSAEKAALRSAAINTTAVEGTAAAATRTAGIWSRAWTTISAAAGAAWAFIAGLPAWAIVAIIAAIALLIVAVVAMFNKDFRERIFDILKSVWNGIAKLPRVFADAFIALARVVQRAVEQIVDMLSYLNPFARHSPSLVDNVTAGVGEIINQYKRLRSIPNMLATAASAHNKFLSATAPIAAAKETQQRNWQRESIVKAAPAAGPAFDEEVRQINALKSVMAGLESSIKAQEAVTKKWQDALDAVDARLRNETYTLNQYKDQLDALNEAISSHQSEIDRLMQTPIEGMNEMSDAIFENEMAQKKLELALMNLGDAGQSVDDLKSKFADLNGEIESLQGQTQDLRLAGAGSDVLGPLNDQLDSLLAQRDAISDQVEEANDLQSQLDALKREGERLNLENSITFDPQIRELDVLINRMDEMPFDEIKKQILAQRDAIASIQPQLQVVQTKYDAQKQVVDQIQKQHDAIQHQLDIENDKLKALKDTYEEINSLVSDMESSISDLVSSSNDLTKWGSGLGAAAASTGGDEFDAAALGDFDIPDATGGLDREGGLADIEQFNKDMQKELDKMMEDMGDVDMFGGIKKKWKDFQADFKRGLGVIGGWWSSAWNGIKSAASVVWGWLQTAWDVVWGAISGTLSAAWGIISAIFGAISTFISTVLGPVFTWLWETIIKPVWDAIAAATTWLWETILKPVFDALIGFITGYVVPVFQLVGAIVEIIVVSIARIFQWLWNNVLKNVFKWIGDGFSGLVTAIKWVWDKILKPVWDAIGNIFKWMWNTVLKPAFDAIGIAFGALGSALGFIWGAVIKPVWDAVGNIFKWMWNTVLKPAFDAMSAGFHGVGDAIKWVWDHVIKPVVNALSKGVVGAINTFIRAFNLVARGVNAIGRVLHISVHVDEMETISAPQFASGGRLPASDVGGGFVTDGPRAIVGEGRPQHPEYVVPTDPQFRTRAISLWGMLTKDLGIEGLARRPVGLEAGGKIPELGIGDIVGGAVSIAGDVLQKGREVAVNAILGPMVEAVNALLDRIPVEFISEPIRKAVNGVFSWAKGKPVNFASGGRFNVPRTPGGMHMVVGEGRSGEQVQVLPYDDPGEGGATYNFYGDLAFPNITDPNDAQAFIDNLKRLTK